MPTKTHVMNILFSQGISSFGGLNFVHEELEKLGVQMILEANLPKLPPQSQYSWKDIFYTLLSIYFSGGCCIEDAKTVLSQRFGESPLFKLCSPDTILRRLKELEVQDSFCKTKRGTVEHQYNHNGRLAEMNIKLLKKCGEFDKEEVVLDYDNTIAFNEKADSKMTYKRDYGYQPGVCFLNESKVLYLENRNGNSDAKSFQAATLARMFACLGKHGVHKVDKFRADSASYQFDVIRLLEGKASHFYIGAVERQFDVLKNDFGWSKLPFSILSQNTVFLYFTAIIKNLYTLVLMNLSSRHKALRPNLRMKRFIFLFISIPARWVKRSRQWYLRLYGSLP